MEYTTEKIINIPKKLSLDFDVFDYLAELQSIVIDSVESKIILDFQNCEFSHAIFTAFLGSLSVWAANFNKTLVYRVDRRSKLYEYIKRSGLYNYITGDTVDYTNGNSIPFRKVHMDDSEIIDYISNILELAPVKLTTTAEEILFKNIYEIFNNAVEHSGSCNGVYACGHWMPRKKELVFSVYDTGIGIPAHVKSHINNDFDSVEAINWALVKGNSTKQLANGTPRGLGLSDLKNFIELNNGYFTIISNDVIYSYNGSVSYKYLSKPIIGTMVSFIIRNDEEHIYFAR